ncbi:uncharacterized protein J4E78_006773 [Alternaria triticimaculans]|uniref:uncharacterized protein n=1 Tax=Alternaria triticimaculans TaxID=297637 RepID=UPI0020C2C27B|nr:uncharacterized protein J4E78_006773 [Alternaria triticimaculans]KAI4656882.1 hypothetical protein J4E78_006773 [Alternaria triticimaculans]
MSALQSCQFKTDHDLFRALKQRYVQSKERCQGLMSFKKPTALRFVKASSPLRFSKRHVALADIIYQFRLYHHRLVDIQEINDIPPAAQNCEYDYSPMPADNVPPIGPNLLMHFFLHPDESPSFPVLLPSIPKRKNNRLEPCPVRGSNIGWGLDVVTGVDELKLFGLALLGTLASIIFGLVWSVMKHDIQGAFAVAGFFFVIFTFTIASVKALDF